MQGEGGPMSTSVNLCWMTSEAPLSHILLKWWAVALKETPMFMMHSACNDGAEEITMFEEWEAAIITLLNH